MAEFKRGDTVRRVAGRDTWFPVGATALVVKSQDQDGEVYISVNGEYGGCYDEETWYVPATDIELVTPAPVAQSVRKIVQISTVQNDYHNPGGAFVVCDDGTALRFFAKDGTWLQLPPIPQPESAP